MRIKQRPSCRPLSGADRMIVPRLWNRIALDAPRPSKVEQLQSGLLTRALKMFPESHFQQPLLRAAKEAAHVAERTGYALLLLPELFAELAVAEMLKAEYLRMGRI